MPVQTHYDAIVIGTGQGGKPLAQALAKAKKRTAIVERGPVGGSCINVGCTPTKTMVASARVAYLARRAADYGVLAGQVRVELGVVRQRKRAIVELFRSGSERGLEHTEGLDLIRGHARFTGPHAIAVEPVGAERGEARVLTAETIYVNTGTRPARPPTPGLDTVEVLDPGTLMELGELPEHLLVLGGGYIGLEFGQMFRRFGSRVTIVHRGAQVLSREDPDISEAIAEILREDGIDLRLACDALCVAPADNGGIALTVKQRGDGRTAAPAAEQTLVGSHLLVAVGRTPNADDLGLDAAGIETDTRGFIRVDERLATNVAGVYALGDVKGGPAFTHIAYDDFRFLRETQLEGKPARRLIERPVPYTVFIDPQLGRIGLTETQARAAGRELRVVTMPMTHVARALEADETRGMIKAVVDARTDRILGAAVLGLEGGEVCTVLQVAMMGDLPYTAIKDAVFSHPTLAESLNNLFMRLDR